MGQDTNSIDGKNRLPIPSRHRKNLPEGETALNLFLYKKGGAQADGYPHIVVWTSLELEKLQQRVESHGSDEDEEALKYYLSQIEVLSMDGNGRITLPPRFSAAAELTKKALVVGCGKTLEIWNPDHYRAWQGKRPAGDGNLAAFASKMRELDRKSAS